MNFERAFATIINSEGGYSNDPRDPGGETKYGISKHAYPHVDIKSLTIAQAEQIYRADYWDKCRCDEMPKSLKLPLFDSAVNQGADKAIKLLQTALNLNADGVIGPRTMERAHQDAEAAANFLTERILHYASLPTFPTFGRGWVRRVMRLMLP
jgi:lysozyme family protein